MTPAGLVEAAAIAVCLFAGGVLKGATGAGTPIIAIPALALMFDVRFAIAVMVVPNTVTNLVQGWQYRAHLPARRFVLPLVIGACLGVLAGTWLLVHLPLDVLPLFVAVAVFVYIGLRLRHPDWALGLAAATRLALPAGLLSGLLQGASGLSAPVSITFLNAMRLPRPVFIAAISAMFVSFTLMQLPALALSGVLGPREAVLSCVALAPIAVGMPVGSWIARHLPPQVFDRVILILLTAIAIRLLAGLVW